LRLCGSKILIDFLCVLCDLCGKWVFMIIRDLGTIDFQEAYAIQERLAAEVFAGSTPETLLLLDHPPVYTIGSGGNEGNVLDPAIAPIRINRGGDVT
jgi:lipoyl(octanoyl) transferase